MRLKPILATLLAGALLASGCSKDENDSRSSGPDAKMGISFTLPIEVGTRTQDASADESQVKTISVYIFDSNGIEVSKGAYSHFDNITAAFDKVGNTYTLKATENIETVSGTGIQIYVAINHPSPTAYGTKNALLTATAQVEDLCKTVPAATAKGFAMFSAVETVNLKEYDDSDPTSVNDIVLDVDRVVAKVVASTQDPTYTITWSSNSLDLVYTVSAFGVYQEAIETYLVKNTATYSILNTYLNSRAKDNVDVVNGHPSAAGRTDMDGFYIGENAPAVNIVGNTTYAMIATIVRPTMAAKWNNATQTVDWTTSSYNVGLTGTHDIYVVTTDDGATYITHNSTDANEIAFYEDGVIYTYPKGYVHFLVWLNRNGANDYKVWRNEFVHILVNSIKETDGYFPGYPGVPGEPDKPIDPTDPTDPNNPKPIDPPDPIDPEDAEINVEITVNPWKYKANPVELE